MKFQEQVKTYLADYKLTNLAVTVDGEWKRNKKPYPYILPQHQRDLNFLSHYRTETSNYIEDTKTKLHQDFHHLNSSQAVCINFFYPLIAEGQLPLLLKVLQLEDEAVEEWAFEKIISGAERTNFDFYMKLKSGKQLLFEIKYTEREFGKVTSSAKYEKKYQDVYREMLAGKIRPEVVGYDALVKNYQLLRNIAYVDNENSLIFICPEHNKKLHKEYRNVMENIVVPSLHKNIQMLSWESLLEGLEALLKVEPNIPSKLVKHYEDFKEKYFYS